MLPRSPLALSPRTLAIATLALCLPVTTLLYLANAPRSIIVTFGGDALGPGRAESIPAVDVEAYMQAYLDELASARDPSRDEEQYGLKLGGDITLASYTRELLDAYTTYLVPTSSGRARPAAEFVELARARLALAPPSAPWPPRPRQVITTDADPGNMPYEWHRWAKLMPDWERRVFDDAGLADWVARVFGGTRAAEVWASLPRVVLQTDIFRYMILLVEGGIWSDSDTAPIIEAEQWGLPYESGTPPLLTHLARVLSLASARGVDDGDEGRGKAAWAGPLIEDGGELGEPGLVVSIETDAVMYGWDDWREVGLARKVQMTQWTISARPGHPVLLDAVGRTLRKSEEMARAQAEAQSKGEPFVPDTALEWTGPGVFTDCVYRYLLARYGISPEDLFYLRGPVRVGDVLVLPSGSFSSVSPWTPRIPQRAWAAVHHAFLGRWRPADPGIEEFERLKKAREDEEKERAELALAAAQATQALTDGAGAARPSGAVESGAADPSVAKAATPVESRAGERRRSRDSGVGVRATASDAESRREALGLRAEQES
ncbi:hypothetical protein Q5752_003675 [Cryptotrichosporon argae]